MNVACPRALLRWRVSGDVSDLCALWPAQMKELDEEARGKLQMSDRARLDALRELETAFNSRISELESERQASVANLHDTYRARLTDSESRQQSAMMAIEREYSSKVDEAREQRLLAVRAAEEESRRVLAQLQQSHDETVSNMERTYSVGGAVSLMSWVFAVSLL